MRVAFITKVDLVKSLPKKERQRLINILEQDEPLAIPEWQKQEVQKRIKKYNKHPELLIDEKRAQEIINQM